MLFSKGMSRQEGFHGGASVFFVIMVDGSAIDMGMTGVASRGTLTCAWIIAHRTHKVLGAVPSGPK